METYDILYRDNLEALKEEINAYKDEANIWKLHGDIKNSPGNLCIHLCGNLKHFFGAVLGGTGYERQRDYEFSVNDLPREELIREIDSTIEVITSIFKDLTQEDLHKKFPIYAFGENKSVEWVITRLGFHFGYHLGQINYHRRMFDY